MNNQYTYPLNNEIITPEQKYQNVQIAFSEIDNAKALSFVTYQTPVYKTVEKFTIRAVYELFGLGNTALYRLAGSTYSKCIPDILVIHCNTSNAVDDNVPIILDDKLFVSHIYFANWITSENPAEFELDILKILMKHVDMLQPSYN